MRGRHHDALSICLVALDDHATLPGTISLMNTSISHAVLTVVATSDDIVLAKLVSGSLIVRASANTLGHEPLTLWGSDTEIFVGLSHGRIMRWTGTQLEDEPVTHPARIDPGLMFLTAGCGSGWEWLAFGNDVVAYQRNNADGTWSVLHDPQLTDAPSACAMSWDGNSLEAVAVGGSTLLTLADGVWRSQDAGICVRDVWSGQRGDYFAVGGNATVGSILQARGCSRRRRPSA